MKKNILYLSIILLILACSYDEPNYSLRDAEDEYACEKFTADSCEITLIGPHFLSTASKNLIKNLRMEIQDSVIFENANGDEIDFAISRIYIDRGGAWESPEANIECEYYCLDFEFSEFEMECEDFFFTVKVTTGYTDNIETSNNIQDEVQTILRIKETRINSTSSTIIIQIPFRDHLENEIPIDTAEYIFYPNIELNGEVYYDIITWDASSVNGLTQPYFSFEKGIVAYKDYDRVLYTRR